MKLATTVDVAAAAKPPGDVPPPLRIDRLDSWANPPTAGVRPTTFCFCMPEPGTPAIVRGK